MATQKRIQYVKTTNGLNKQLIASAADITEINPIEGIDSTNVQGALEELKNIADTGGVTGVKGNAETTYRKGDVNITPANIGLGNLTNDAQIKRSEMAVAGGVATLDEAGKVPAAQLPSYVDDVLEYASKSAFPSTGETGKIYVAKDTNKTYRWGGTEYAEISASLALGETSSTAYAGDKGKKNAEDIKSLQTSAKGTAQRIEEIEESISNIEHGGTQVAWAETADELTTAREISLSGDATGKTTFSGGADANIEMTLANTGVAAGTYSAVAVDSKGRVTAGSQIIEWGASGQTTPSNSLAVGGLFFELVE